MKEPQASEFRKRKVFLVESRTVFWGTGTALSPGGRDFLDTLATFAAQVPGRIVISESGPARPRAGEGEPQATPSSDVAILRAATVLDYLTTRGIPKDRCSVGVLGMSPEQSLDRERMLEIVLLDTSVYQ